MALHFPSVSGGQEGVRAITHAAETILGEEVRAKTWPIPGSEQTTEPIVTKFGMNDHWNNLFYLIEGFFEIRSLVGATGPKGRNPGATKMAKIFFSDFFHFFGLIAYLHVFSSQQIVLCS